MFLFDPISPVTAALDQDCFADVLLVDQLSKHVAIRLSSSSTEFSQFNSLFRVSSCPSVCFLSSKGEVLQVVSELDQLTASNLGHVLQVLVVKKEIEARRLQKQEEEEKQKNAAELKRREDAKAVLDARKQLEDRRLAAEASKTREAQEASRRHKEIVVNKVRLERQERMAKSSDSGGELASAAPPVAASAVVVAAAPLSSGAHAKIKFIIGSETITHTFAANDTLGTLRTFVSSRGYSRFSMETVFPRRTLAPSEDRQTLSALGLTPACAIVVSLAPNATLQSVGGVLHGSGQTPHQDAPAPSFFARAASTPGAGGSPTMHPNVNPNYIHPSDPNSFVDSIVTGATWLFSAMTSCGRGRQRVVAAPAPAPAPEASAAARRGGRTRPGGYEELQQQE